MKKESKRINELLLKYRNNQCTRAEYEELIVLAQAPGNEKTFRAITRKDWELQSDSVSKTPVNPAKSKRRIWPQILKVAAAIALLITAGLGLFRWLSVEEPLIYTTGNGEVKEFILPDGSEVTLNANSSLTWIPVKRQVEDRLVQLEGEAFFHVVKEKLPKSNQTKNRGFQVRTPKMTINVLGTSFNVAARQEHTEVFLEEGSVELQLPELPSASERMIPGERVVLNNQTGTLVKKEAEKLSTSASWISGVLTYNDRTMGDVLQNLSELFGVKITCRDQDLQSKKINLGVPYMDWENTRRALEMAIGVEFVKEGDAYVVLEKDKNDIH